MSFKQLKILLGQRSGLYFRDANFCCGKTYAALPSKSWQIMPHQVQLLGPSPADNITSPARKKNLEAIGARNSIHWRSNKNMSIDSLSNFVGTHRKVSFPFVNWQLKETFFSRAWEVVNPNVAFRSSSPTNKCVQIQGQTCWLYGTADEGRKKSNQSFFT